LYLSLNILIVLELDTHGDRNGKQAVDDFIDCFFYEGFCDSWIVECVIDSGNATTKQVLFCDDKVEVLVENLGNKVGGVCRCDLGGQCFEERPGDGREEVDVE
jgi:hypothetical protein